MCVSICIKDIASGDGRIGGWGSRANTEQDMSIITKSVELLRPPYMHLP